MPGFIDSHVHTVDFGQEIRSINAVAELYSTIADLQRAIREKAKSGGTWKGRILGRNYESNRMAERRWPTREELDAAASENLMMIAIREDHSCVVNSKALELSEITKDTQEPEGGVIGNNPATGEPTGVLADAVDLVGRAIPKLTVEEIKKGIIEAGQAYMKLRITSTGDAGAESRPESYRAYQEALQEA